jgi:hypothetical protein
MNTNIEITNINRNFLPVLAEKGGECALRKHNTILTKHCFFSINEGVISDKIKQIRYYSNNFFVAEAYDFVNIGQLNEEIVEKLKLTNDVRYLIFKYKNDNLVDFGDFLFNIADPTRLVFSTITSFSYILTSLRTLNKNGVCFFNLSPQNIAFNLDCGENPVIRNFQTSLQISQLNMEYITNIIKAQHDYTHKPLEVHVLFYLIQNNLSTVSYSFIEEICEKFVKNLPFLNIFSEKFGASYKDVCVASLKKYINQPQTDIILDILENSDKWDVYSLSMIYLHIFGSICRVFSLQPNFVTKFTTELSKNIHPNPEKRSTLDELSANYTRLLSEENDWSFVKNLFRDKMPQLFSILGE